MPFKKNNPGCGNSADCGCEEPTTGCCAPTGPAQYLLIDLGAGGWVDAACSACDAVQGQYILKQVDFEGNDCVCRYLCRTEDWCGDEFSLLDIIAYFQCVGLGVGVCFVDVIVRILHIQGFVEVVYRHVFDDECNCDAPLTLTKFREGVGTICTGSMPSTITVELTEGPEDCEIAVVPDDDCVCEEPPDTILLSFNGETPNSDSECCWDLVGTHVMTGTPTTSDCTLRYEAELEIDCTDGSFTCGLFVLEIIFDSMASTTTPTLYLYDTSGQLVLRWTGEPMAGQIDCSNFADEIQTLPDVIPSNSYCPESLLNPTINSP